MPHTGKLRRPDRHSPIPPCRRRRGVGRSTARPALTRRPGESRGQPVNKTQVTTLKGSVRRAFLILVVRLGEGGSLRAHRIPAREFVLSSTRDTVSTVTVCAGFVFKRKKISSRSEALGMTVRLHRGSSHPRTPPLHQPPPCGALLCRTRNTL